MTDIAKARIPSRRPRESRLTLMRDGQIIDAPTPQARSLYERWQNLLEDLGDASRSDREWLMQWISQDEHPIQVISHDE